MTRHECQAEEGCLAVPVARGVCHKHYEKLRRWKTLPPLAPKPSIRDRYMSLVDTSAGLTACHEWQGRRDANGYGVLTIGGVVWLAHRLGHALHLRTLLKAEFMLHQCDNPPCQNLLHFKIGNQAQNMREAAERGRMAIGERSGKAKLTNEAVRHIKSCNTAAWRLAELYGVGVHAVWDVRTGRTWRHI